MGDELISKEHENQCSVRSDLSEKLSNTSIMFVIGVPVFIGPFICLLGHILISTCVCLKNAVWKNRNSRHPNDSNDPVHGIVEHKLLIGFIMVSKFSSLIKHIYFHQINFFRFSSSSIQPICLLLKPICPT